MQPLSKGVIWTNTGPLPWPSTMEGIRNANRDWDSLANHPKFNNLTVSTQEASSSLVLLLAKCAWKRDGGFVCCEGTCWLWRGCRAAVAWRAELRQTQPILPAACLRACTWPWPSAGTCYSMVSLKMVKLFCIGNSLMQKTLAVLQGSHFFFWSKYQNCLYNWFFFKYFAIIWKLL